jgi:hypothetical protein
MSRTRLFHQYLLFATLFGKRKSCPHIRHESIREGRGVDIWPPLILNLGTRRRCGQLHGPVALPIARGATGTHYIRDWADPSTGKGIIGGKSFLCRYSNPE